MLPLANRAQTSSICSHSAWSPPGRPGKNQRTGQLRTRLLGGGQLGKKFPFNLFYRLVMIENVLGDVVGCATAKGVLDVSVHPRSHGRG